MTEEATVDAGEGPSRRLEQNQKDIALFYGIIFKTSEIPFLQCTRTNPECLCMAQGTAGEEGQVVRMRGAIRDG